ncbi:MAG: hypothetical protein RBT84_04540 [FCB group bacterium]|nr:hypothetical protein [FCB group bacterium]
MFHSRCRDRRFDGLRGRSLCAAMVVAACALGVCPEPARAESLRALIEADWIEQDVRYALAGREALSADGDALPTNDAGVTSAQDAAGGCDGIKNGKLGFHTASGETDPWWQVDLGKAVELDRVVVFNRTDGGNAPRTRKLRVLTATERSGADVSRESDRWDFAEIYQHDGRPFFGVNEGAPLVVDLRGKGIRARVVRLLVPGACSFALDEVEVYAADAPETNLALHRPADQKSVGPYSLAEAQDAPHDDAVSAISEEDRFSLAHSAAILDRAGALAQRLAAHADACGEAEAANALELFQARRDDLAALLDQLEASEESGLDARKAFYFECRRLLRAIAFENPLLGFDRLLFIKRHDPGGLFHMCHQYYGFTAVPGGGLFVLEEPFVPHPHVRDLLAEAVVENGRLAGQPLIPGSFLSPELSFDGDTVLFAYTQALGDYPEWSPRSSYHIFKVNRDGTGLTQLTDGATNDFDPCFLPGGRIVFVSERRGGYLRCGGSAPPLDSPTYTLHSMAPDGTDVVCLSFHETHEWHPSVTHDGMLVYTRWDYVDRDTNIAHHIWTCYPDGRDPRAFHGNYPLARESRPWMEMSIRAIPGSHRFVATAAAHHGHAFGSLVLIDPHIEDDGAMAQLTRLTPEAPLPEAETPVKAIREHMAYGTPWPLSEDDYLCVYGANGATRGIYWLDRFGNRELIYRDPAISCLSPIPLRPRPAPPVVPDGTTQTADSEPRPATIAVMKVYNSDFVWPGDVQLRALRIIHVLPKTTPPSNKPRIGVAGQTNARAVLGTVPVEPDGSAFFEAPVGKLIYFQALDETGMAVQSMRSGTYVHPGEQLTCLGCHESKYRATPSAPARGRVPLALRRAPSPLQPEPEGSRPFSYVRLVQPVLDRHCVACHQREDALELSGAVDGEHGWTRSYANLAKTYGFYFDSNKGSIGSKEHGGSRTVAGKFGARASALLPYLGEDHYGTRLTEEEFHRVTLWLDCNSEFYGAYENPEAQARGELVWPSLD